MKINGLHTKESKEKEDYEKDFKRRKDEAKRNRQTAYVEESLVPFMEYEEARIISDSTSKTVEESEIMMEKRQTWLDIVHSIKKRFPIPTE